MNQQLLDKCDHFITNRDIIKKTFGWDNSLMVFASSAIFTGMDMTANSEKLMVCKDILKQHAGAFSEFRGNLRLPLLCKMALADNPEQYFSDVEWVYRLLNKSTWVGSEYKILAAMIIYDHVGVDDVDYYIEKTNEIYKCMKKEHRFLTSDADTPLAALLAVSGFDVHMLIKEMETCYQLLKENFYDSNAVQSLSHVMALDETYAEEKCRRVVDIFQKLKVQKHKFGSGYELPILGLLSMLDLPVDDIVRELIDADEYLKTQKGFGSFSLGDTRRRMYAAQMVLNVHRPASVAMDHTVMNSSLAMAIATEVCMMAATTAAIAASNASHS